MTEAFARPRCRVHLAQIDKTPSGASQTKTLLGLVHLAKNTKFGLEHDFGRIRTEVDYRRLVPMTAAVVPIRSWPTPNIPIAGSTWPAPLAGIATLSAAEKTGRQVLVTPSSLHSWRCSTRTALAYLFEAHPRGQLLGGSLLFLDASALIGRGDARRPPMSSSDFVRLALPGFCRPYAQTVDPTNFDVHTQLLLSKPLTMVDGALTQIVDLFSKVKTLTKRDRILDVWPQILGVLYSCKPAERGLVAILREELGPKVTLMEIGRFPEGIVAVEDPQRHLLRLLVDHGIYYEFIPAEETGKHNPARLSLKEIETGLPYELAITSPTGVWSARSGCGVCFESLDPPLLRFVEAPRIEVVEHHHEATTPAVNQAALPGLKIPPPHRRIAGIPAAPPESFAHNPWLVPVDRE